MDIALMLLGVTAFPVAGLGLLLWLTHLEETLPRDVRSALRASTPPPVLAVPARRPEPSLVPERKVPQVPSTDPERLREARPPADQAFSRSTRLSLGGSTNR